jgi:iron(III) transport system substrate-binding protein
MGNFQVEKVPVAAIGKNQIAAQKLLDQAGYK